VARALAQRRRLLSQLTANLDVLFTTLGQRGTQLASAIDSGSRTLEVTAGRDAEIATAMRELGPTLSELQRSLAAASGLSEPLVPALDELLPVADNLQPASRSFRDFVPKLDQLVGKAKHLVADGRRPVRQLAGGLKGLPERIQSDQIPALKELLDLTDLLYKYRNGFIQFADNLSGATSLNKNTGPYLQTAIINAEITPSGLGLGTSAAKSTGGRPSKLSRMLAETLEYVCRQDNSMACLLRFNLPGLPSSPLIGPEKGKGG
jgi:ABC-type transporter Mla subunit MlaD